MKNVHILFFLLFTLSLHSQSVRNGSLNEENFGAVAPEDFDFAGVWQANMFEVVFDQEQQKVVLFEFRDSITEIIFFRATGRTDTKQYEMIPLQKDIDVFPYVTMAIMDSEYACLGWAKDSSYTFYANIQLYGADAVQFNADVPESSKFFGHNYKSTEDLNIFWELIRYYP